MRPIPPSSPPLPPHSLCMLVIQNMGAGSRPKERKAYWCSTCATHPNKTYHGSCPNVRLCGHCPLTPHPALAEQASQPTIKERALASSNYKVPHGQQLIFLLDFRIYVMMSCRLLLILPLAPLCVGVLVLFLLVQTLTRA